MNRNTKKLVYSAMFLAIGVILPQAFHAIPDAGSVFLPMHIPVLLAGFVVGPWWGLAVGILTPILSHLIFHMPAAMVLPGMIGELAVYGLMTGLLSRRIRMTNATARIYVVLILSMLSGRVAAGLLNALIFRVGNYSLPIWLTGSFVTALPGIIIQLILIPVVVMALRKAGRIPED